MPYINFDIPRFGETPEWMEDSWERTRQLPDPEPIPGGHAISAAQKGFRYLFPEADRVIRRGIGGEYDSLQDAVADFYDRPGQDGLDMGLGMMAPAAGNIRTKLGANPQAFLYRSLDSEKDVKEMADAIKGGYKTEKVGSTILPTFTSSFGQDNTHPSAGIVFSIEDPKNIKFAGARDLFTKKTTQKVDPYKKEKLEGQARKLYSFQPPKLRTEAIEAYKQNPRAFKEDIFHNRGLDSDWWNWFDDYIAGDRSEEAQKAANELIGNYIFEYHRPRRNDYIRAAHRLDSLAKRLPEYSKVKPPHHSFKIKDIPLEPQLSEKTPDVFNYERPFDMLVDLESQSLDDLLRLQKDSLAGSFPHPQHHKGGFINEIAYKMGDPREVAGISLGKLDDRVNKALLEMAGEMDLPNYTGLWEVPGMFERDKAIRGLDRYLNRSRAPYPWYWRTTPEKTYSTAEEWLREVPKYTWDDLWLMNLDL